MSRHELTEKDAKEWVDNINDPKEWMIRTLKIED